MICKVKKNKKIILGIIIGLFLSGVIAYAEDLVIQSSNISYDNSTSGLKSTTLKGAIDELYEKTTERNCKVVEGKKTTVGSTANCEGENFYISTTGSTITLIAQYGLNSSYRQSTTPTPVNYSDATKYIEAYAKNALSGIKGNMSFYGHATHDEVIKLSTGKITQWSPAIYYTGEKLSIGSSSMGYWVGSKTIFRYIGGPNGYDSYDVSDNTVTNVSLGSLGIYTFYARAMIKVPSSVIIDL